MDKETQRLTQIKYREGEAEGEAEREAERETERDTDTHTDTLTPRERQTDRPTQTDRERQRQTGRHTDTQTDRRNWGERPRLLHSIFLERNIWFYTFEVRRGEGKSGKWEIPERETMEVGTRCEWLLIETKRLRNRKKKNER